MNEKIERLNEIKELARGFCEGRLNEELTGYVLKLCDTLGRKRKISITRGRAEIWAASIIHVIARLNFLFDRESDFFLSADMICDFFGTKKSTVGNKATQIEKICKLGWGSEGYCSPDITDAMTLLELPNGLVIPKNMMSGFDLVYELADEEESKEIEEYVAKQRPIKEQKLAEKKARREEKKKQKMKDDKQLGLFD